MIEDTEKEVVAPGESVLIGEVFTTSGPRKDHEENKNPNVELGEDSGGVVLLGGEHALVWVADGTSQTSKRGIYSSRILALDLGLAFSSKVTSRWLDKRNRNAFSPAAILSLTAEVIDEVFNHWQESLKPGTPLYETLAGELRDAASFLEFSTTFSAAGLSRSGEFNLAGVGDSYLILKDSMKSTFLALKKGQITFHLQWRNERLVFVKFVPPLQHLKAEAVNLAILSTDGTKDTIRFLYETTTAGDTFNLDGFYQLKKNIAQVRPRVQDDKTMAIVGRFHED